jgi:two-component system CheB/CheR fusion protein
MDKTAHCRVLVVDDYPDTNTSLALLLRLWGHEVFTAEDGPSALQVVEHCKPDAVLLDVGLPGMDGYELAQQLRQGPLRRALLVTVSGFGQEADHRRSQEAGCDCHLVKPVEPDVLRELLESCPDQRN